MRAEFSRSVEVQRSPRVVQVEGMFGMEPTNHIERRWSIDLPLDERPWSIGLVVGPSGSGKTTILRECFGYDQDGLPGDVLDLCPTLSVLDLFPDEVPTDQVVRLLGAVGFSSPPAWLRPFMTLSSGEQFRAELAWCLATAKELTVVDEFTSTVDRTVARTASVAVARHVRSAEGVRLVAASCHYDIVDWLQPDWVFDTGLGTFTWRSLHRRPAIDLDLCAATRAQWAAFAAHHYLSASLARQARCVIGTVEGRPATFVAVVATPSPRGYSVQREHRLVCLPDFQGVGLGHATADLVAACYRRQGWRYRSTTSHPAVIGHRARSKLWDLVRGPSFEHSAPPTGSRLGSSSGRRTASFEYVGPAATARQAEILEVPAFPAG